MLPSVLPLRHIHNSWAIFFYYVLLTASRAEIAQSILLSLSFVFQHRGDRIPVR